MEEHGLPGVLRGWQARERPLSASLEGSRKEHLFPRLLVWVEAAPRAVTTTWGPGRRGAQGAAAGFSARGWGGPGPRVHLPSTSRGSDAAPGQPLPIGEPPTPPASEPERT